jgi:hypothetical protein
MELRSLFSTLLIVFLVTSCATVKTYEGESLPSEEVAVIKSNYWCHLTGGIVVREVDGKDVGFNPGDIHVLPGMHTVKIRVTHSHGYLGTMMSSGTVNLYAEAGHTYMVDGRIYRLGERVWIWIVDEETGEVVAGMKP